MYVYFNKQIRDLNKDEISSEPWSENLLLKAKSTKSKVQFYYCSLHAAATISDMIIQIAPIQTSFVCAVI
jgi:hypothetical protein